jgi:hypothetical protein
MDNKQTEKMNSTKKRSLFEVLNDALVTAASGLPI